MRLELKQIVTISCQALITLIACAAPVLADDAELTRNIPDIDAAPQVSSTQQTSEPEQRTELQSVRSVAATVPTLSAEREKLISPPGEEVYYPVRQDGQPFVLNIDQTVNLTRAINQFAWDPRIEGEVWTPFDQPELIERASRLMTTWPEYDEANIYRSFTRVNKFLERISGFGP